MQSCEFPLQGFLKGISLIFGLDWTIHFCCKCKMLTKRQEHDIELIDRWMDEILYWNELLRSKQFQNCDHLLDSYFENFKQKINSILNNFSIEFQRPYLQCGFEFTEILAISLQFTWFICAYYLVCIEFKNF